MKNLKLILITAVIVAALGWGVITSMKDNSTDNPNPSMTVVP